MERKKVFRFKSKIIKKINLTSNVKNLTLSVPKEFDFYPGQFVSLILNKDGKEIRRPYSISSPPYKNQSENSLDICIKIIPNGLATPLIDSLKIGDEIDVLGPMGTFIINDSLNDLVFISTGTGIGPFKSMINYLLKNNFQNKIVLLTGYRYKEDVLYDKEFKELEKKHDNFTYHTILSKESENDYVQNLVEKNINKNYHYYICGLKEMVNSVKELLEQKGIHKENVFFERYD